jgi:5-aminolevulinate synthase
MDYQKFFADALTDLKKQGQYRIFLDIERCAGEFPKALCYHHGNVDEITVWCGNDYLGMGQHPKVMQAVHESIERCGVGSGGTRNISGTTHAHVLVEKELCDLHNKEAALVFTSGYIANETTLSTLGARLPGCIFLSDENNHASIIHGIRNSRAEKKIFRHNDVAHLEELLQTIEPHRPKIIVFESVYSMDGDISPIKEICTLAKRYHALTYLDEVHGVGMYGHKGGGIAQHLNVEQEVDIIQGTFGKAFGLMGGYIAGSHQLIDFVRSFSPGFIFTTSLPPAIMAGVTASIRHLKISSLERERHQLNVRYLKTKLREAGLSFLPNDSHIVPIIVGNAQRCKHIADCLLQEYKIYVQPINYPTVPVGTERLRLTPSALHTPAMIDKLVEALTEVYNRLALKKAA